MIKIGATTLLKVPQFVESKMSILEVSCKGLRIKDGHLNLPKKLTLNFDKRGSVEFSFEQKNDVLTLLDQGERKKVFQAFWAEFLVSMQNGPSIKELILAGFNVRSIKHAIDISHVSNEAEYQEVLELRYYVNKVVENLPLPAESPKEFADSYDEHSSIILARIGGKLVGTNRITFINGDMSKSEYFPLGMVNESHQRYGFVESTKMVTLPDYRGSDLFISLLNESGRIVMLSGERFVLGDTWKHLLPVYAKLGYESTGVKNPGDDGWQVVVDIKRVVNIDSIGFFMWNVCYGELINQLYREGILRIGLKAKLALRLRPCFQGLIESAFYKIQERKRRSKK